MNNFEKKIDDAINAARPAFESERRFQKEKDFCLQALTNNSYLAKMAADKPNSLSSAMRKIGYSNGLTLDEDSQYQCYLVPRNKQAELELSYKAIIERSDVMWAKAELVYDHDHFEIKSMGERPIHKYNPFSTDRGPIIGAYVVAKLPNGDC